MITRLEPKGKNAFLTLLEQDPLFGGRIATALDCWEGKDAVCGFYQIDDTAALLVQGGGSAALRCGSPGTGGGTYCFSAVCRGRHVDRPAPPVCRGGRCSWLNSVARPAGGGMSFAPPIDVTIQPAPSLWALRQSGFFAQGDPDGWYADACARSARGLAEIWIAEQQGARSRRLGIQPAGYAVWRLPDCG